MERKGDVNEAWEYLIEAVVMAPENLWWKVWMSGSWLEAHLGDLGTAETLVLQCVNDIPEKQLGLGYLELSKFWELKGDFEKAESLMLLSMEKI